MSPQDTQGGKELMSLLLSNHIPWVFSGRCLKVQSCLTCTALPSPELHFRRRHLKAASPDAAVDSWSDFHIGSVLAKALV